MANKKKGSGRVRTEAFSEHYGSRKRRHIFSPKTTVKPSGSESSGKSGSGNKGGNKK